MFSAKILVGVAAALCCAPAAFSQSTKTKVVPVSLTSKEGPTNSYMPLTYNAFRNQQIWLGTGITAKTAVINSINFRADGSFTGSSKTYSSMTVNVGPTTVTPAKMSTTFASNITGKMTQVLKGKFVVPAQSAPKTPPAAFNIKFPFGTNLILNTTKDHLIMDWVVAGNATSKTPYYLDAVNTSAPVGGTVTPFGTTGKFSTGDTVTLTADATKLTQPGGSLDILAKGFSQIYPSFLILGISNKTFGSTALPWELKPLNAPGNYLYVSMDAVVPFPIKNTSPKFALFSAAIPNSPSLPGFTAYAQAYFGDPKANGGGIVSSHGISMTMAGGPSGPVTQMLGSTNSSSKTGNFLFGRTVGGPVAQFVGVIP